MAILVIRGSGDPGSTGILRGVPVGVHCNFVRRGTRFRCPRAARTRARWLAADRAARCSGECDRAEPAAAARIVDAGALSRRLCRAPGAKSRLLAVQPQSLVRGARVGRRAAAFSRRHHFDPGNAQVSLRARYPRRGLREGLVHRRLSGGACLLACPGSAYFRHRGCRRRADGACQPARCGLGEIHPGAAAARLCSDPAHLCGEDRH